MYKFKIKKNFFVTATQLFFLLPNLLFFLKIKIEWCYSSIVVHTIALHC